MLSEYLRDSAMSALILGFFASTWFGWAQERPPAGWRGPLIVGSIVSILGAVAGGVLAWRNWSGISALNEPGAMTRFGITVGIEFGLAALGAAVLAVRGGSEYTAVWICLVVGVHFWPLAPLFADPSLVVLGAVLVVVALAGPAAPRRTTIAVSAIVGVGAGAALLTAAASALLRALF
jgi:hypothetical protein